MGVVTVISKFAVTLHEMRTRFDLLRKSMNIMAIVTELAVSITEKGAQFLTCPVCNA
jgi:hypothetical protein